MRIFFITIIATKTKNKDFQATDLLLTMFKFFSLVAETLENEKGHTER